MHYEERVKAIDESRNVLTAISGESLGSGEELSDGDIAAVAEYYDAPHMAVSWIDNRSSNDASSEINWSPLTSWGANCCGRERIIANPDETDGVATQKIGTALGLDGSRNCVLAWNEKSLDSQDSEIFYTVLNRGGAPVIEQTLIASASLPDMLSAPSVFVRISGDFFVCWEKYADDQSEIFVKGFKRDGSERFAKKSIATVSATNRAPLSPQIAGTRNEFSISWIDRQPAGSTLFVQSLDIDGNEAWPTIKVAENIAEGVTPGIAMRNGRIAVAWAQSSSDIRLSTYDADGGLLAGPLSLMPDNRIAVKHLDVAMNFYSNVIVVWELEFGLASVIWAKQVDTDGETLRDAWMIDGGGSLALRRPSICINFDNGYFIACEDYNVPSDRRLAILLGFGVDHNRVLGPTAINTDSDSVPNKAMIAMAPSLSRIPSVFGELPIGEIPGKIEFPQ